MPDPLLLGSDDLTQPTGMEAEEKSDDRCGNAPLPVAPYQQYARDQFERRAQVLAEANVVVTDSIISNIVTAGMTVGGQAAP
jgi:hypothetical protein